MNGIDIFLNKIIAHSEEILLCMVNRLLSFFFVSLVLVFLYIPYYYITYLNEIESISDKGIRKVTSVILPTIINDQTYFYSQAKYKDLTFFQYIKSNDYVSNYIKGIGRWPDCEDMYNVYFSGSRRGVFIDFGANIGSCSFLFAQAGVKVYAFEPLPNNLFPLTVTTFGNKNFTKYITIYPYALGKEE